MSGELTARSQPSVSQPQLLHRVGGRGGHEGNFSAGRLSDLHPAACGRRVLDRCRGVMVAGVQSALQERSPSEQKGIPLLRIAAF